MVLEELEDTDRGDIIDELETIVSSCINYQSIDEDLIKVSQSEGTMIDIPYQRSKRKADLLIDFNNLESIPTNWKSELRGIAFKLILDPESRDRYGNTLGCYWKAGYQPVLVTPGEEIINDGGDNPSYRWFVDFFQYCSAIEIVSTDPILFSKSGIIGSELVLSGLGESLIRARTHDC